MDIQDPKKVIVVFTFLLILPGVIIGVIGFCLAMHFWDSIMATTMIAVGVFSIVLCVTFGLYLEHTGGNFILPQKKKASKKLPSEYISFRSFNESDWYIHFSYPTANAVVFLF